MKLKNDFITNSSSASFIMYINTLEEMSVGDFSELIRNHIKHVIECDFVSDISISEDSIELVEMIGPRVFSIRGWTSMYNNIYDIPKWMRHLMLEDKMGILQQYGMNVTKMQVIED